MISDPQNLIEDKTKTTLPRCKDCDSDCWDAPNKLKCWLP